jgi:hypothetical protein
MESSWFGMITETMQPLRMIFMYNVFNASGIRKWTLYGVNICSAANAQKNSTIADVGNGNAIITWEDRRDGNHDVYAQKIDSSGNILWTTNGVAVCNKTTTQKSPKIVSDNAGGAIIVWEDSLNFYWDIYAQRISSAGAIMWTTGGVAVCSSPNTQANPRIEADGLGGAIITWQDKRNNADYDIYAQKIDASGATQWTANGVVICNAVNTQNNARIESDGANGAIIGWQISEMLSIITYTLNVLMLLVLFSGQQMEFLYVMLQITKVLLI